LIRWAKGGDANIVAIDFDRVTLDSSLSSPPGSLVDGHLVNGGDAIRIKVRGCKKEGDRFRIEARVLDASRDLRTRLAALSANAERGQSE
jgi:hypothetical protein